MVLPVAINCFQLIEIAFVPRGICHFGPPWDLQRALRLTSLGLLGPPSFNLSVFTHFVGLVLCDLVSVEKSTAGKVSADESFADLSKGYLDYGGKNPFPPTLPTNNLLFHPQPPNNNLPFHPQPPNNNLPPPPPNNLPFHPQPPNNNLPPPPHNNLPFHPQPPNNNLPPHQPPNNNFTFHPQPPNNNLPPPPPPNNNLPFHPQPPTNNLPFHPQPPTTSR